MSTVVKVVVLNTARFLKRMFLQNRNTEPIVNMLVPLIITPFLRRFNKDVSRMRQRHTSSTNIRVNGHLVGNVMTNVKLKDHNRNRHNFNRGSTNLKRASRDRNLYNHRDSLRCLEYNRTSLFTNNGRGTPNSRAKIFANLRRANRMVGHNVQIETARQFSRHKSRVVIVITVLIVTRNNNIRCHKRSIQNGSEPTNTLLADLVANSHANHHFRGHRKLPHITTNRTRSIHRNFIDNLSFTLRSTFVN